MTWSPVPTRKHIECTPFDTRGPKRLWDAPAGVVQRARGDVGRLVAHDYLCPVHGRFEVQVPSNDVPDAVACPVEIVLDDDGNCTACGGPNCACTDLACGERAPWSPGVVNVWKSSGEVAS